MNNSIFSCILGPKVYILARNQPYLANGLEMAGDFMFMLGNSAKNLLVFAAPLLVPYTLFRHSHSFGSWSSFMQSALLYYTFAYTMRTFGRFSNVEYRTFIALLDQVKTAPNSELLKRLKQYDYTITSTPIDFAAVPRPSIWFHDRAQSGDNGIPPLIEPLNSLREAIAWFAAHTFGRRLLFPGTILQAFINSNLIEGRRKYIHNLNGQRNVVLSQDKNRVDTMFVDNRGRTGNGEILVICCEGNAGFYEVGVMNTPLYLDYSVLGWNLPGFGESTGSPYPREILHSAEAVMQFATEHLGFAPSQIIIYGWSIGGYAATWSAANYLNVRGLILDACFDDLTPLALARMPGSWAGIVRVAVQNYLDLPVAKQLARYRGPVQLIRRWNDEVIVTAEDADNHTKRASNRAVTLLIDLIHNRHPGLLRDGEDERCVHEWLAVDPERRLNTFPSDDFDEPVVTKDFANLDDSRRHSLIRQLCNKYIVDFESTHNTPLPAEFFNVPTPVKLHQD